MDFVALRGWGGGKRERDQEEEEEEEEGEDDDDDDDDEHRKSVMIPFRLVVAVGPDYSGAAEGVSNGIIDVMLLTAIILAGMFSLFSFDFFFSSF